MESSQSFIGAQVELSAPDGRIFRFHVAALVPYAGDTYAVLEHEAEDGQLLVTHIETENDQPVFVVVGEEDIITAVLEKQVADTIARAMAQLDVQDEADELCDCSCGHEHHHHDCDCGHEHHHHDCDCGHDHHHDCSCGHEHGHRPMPSYIKRQG